MADHARPVSAALYDVLAPTYEEHFAVPHRRAYDDLAWERVVGLLPSEPGFVIDVGCGVGRWADRLVALGHTVVGIEPAAAMAALARERAARLGVDRFTVVDASMEEDQPALIGKADAVMAMGSFQYSTDPDGVLARFHSWLVPGGAITLLVDSLGGLVTELMRSGRTAEAVERATARRGCWQPAPDLAAEMELYDRARLAARLAHAGFGDLHAHGLLVSASILGVPALIADLDQDREATMATQRALAAEEGIADLGKQLLVTGRRAP